LRRYNLGIGKPWFVPQNNEIIPVILEDVRGTQGFRVRA
jgi:hypothetical protein